MFVFVSQYLELFSARVPCDEKLSFSSPLLFSSFFFLSSPNMKKEVQTAIRGAQQASFGSITGSSSSMGWNVRNLSGLGF